MSFKTNTDQMQCQRSFHFEVLKKLHAMKSGKSLVDCQDVEIPTYEEIDSCELEQNENSKHSLDDELERTDLKSESVDEKELDGNSLENLKMNLSKCLQRNQELEDALKIKDTAIRKLLARNAELENELKRKEAMRLSQLELLSLRNVELERELHQVKKLGVSQPDDVAWF
jgi:hypothetical protein